MAMRNDLRSAVVKLGEMLLFIVLLLAGLWIVLFLVKLAGWWEWLVESGPDGPVAAVMFRRRCLPSSLTASPRGSGPKQPHPAQPGSGRRCIRTSPCRWRRRSSELVSAACAWFIYEWIMRKLWARGWLLLKPEAREKPAPDGAVRTPREG